MIPPELHAKLRRLFEHWRVPTIVAPLGVHHDTIRRVIESERFIRPGRQVRPSGLDPYKAFVTATLEQYPRAAGHPPLGHAAPARLPALGHPGAALRPHRPARRARRSLPPLGHPPR